MLLLPQPILELTINGDKVSSAFMSDVLSFTYSDEFHGKSDKIEVELQDGDGLYRAGNGPQKHDIIKAKIGYVGGQMLPCGEFEIEDISASGGRGGDKFTISATSTATSKKVRSKQSEAFEKQKLSQLVKKITARNGLELVGDFDDITFNRITKRREGDLEFLRKIAEDTGHYFTVKGKQAVFVKREAIEKQEPILIFSLTNRDYLKSWNMKEESSGTYSKAEVEYFDGKKNKNHKGEAEDKDVKTGDVLKIKERVESPAHAKKLAKARLDAANDIKLTGSIEFVGLPDLIAGVIIGLDETFGRYKGKYLIGPSDHSITRGGGYVGRAELKKVGEL